MSIKSIFLIIGVLAVVVGIIMMFLGNVEIGGILALFGGGGAVTAKQAGANAARKKAEELAKMTRKDIVARYQPEAIEKNKARVEATIDKAKKAGEEAEARVREELSDKSSKEIVDGLDDKLGDTIANIKQRAKWPSPGDTGTGSK